MERWNAFAGDVEHRGRGPNDAPLLDFTLPTHAGPATLRFIASSAILLALAWIGRWRAFRR